MDEWEDRVRDYWATFDAADRDAAVARMRALVAERGPDDADARFEMGGAYDSTGFEAEAAEEYAAARELGLSGPRLAQLDIQEASTLRNLGRPDEAIDLLQGSGPDPSVGDAHAVFLALALSDAGRPDEALRVALEALVPHLPRYQRSVLAYARALTEPDPD